MAESAAMQARASAPSRLLYNLVEVLLPASALLPAHSLRLVGGSGVIRLGDGRVFVGQDGDYGSLRGVDAVEDAIGDQAPTASLVLAPLSDACQQQIGQPTSQGAPVQILYGELDQTTGQPISDPEVIFYGAIDVCHLRVGKNTRSLTVDLVCAWEALFTIDEGAGLNTSWHQRFHPGQTGFGFVDGVQHAVPWGAKGPRPDQATGYRNYDTDAGGGRTRFRF